MSKWLVCAITGCWRRRDGQGHHIVHRGSGGSDGPWNRINLCRHHHSEIHQVGPAAFLCKYTYLKPYFERARKVERVWQLVKDGKLNPEELQGEEKKIWEFIEGWRRIHRRSLSE